jgi:hypothetical protein
LGGETNTVNAPKSQADVRHRVKMLVAYWKAQGFSAVTSTRESAFPEVFDVDLNQRDTFIRFRIYVGHLEPEGSGMCARGQD